MQIVFSIEFRYLVFDHVITVEIEYIPDKPIIRLVIQLVCIFPGLLMLVYTLHIVFELWIPIMGRYGGNPEQFIMLFMCIGSILFVLMTVIYYNIICKFLELYQ